MIELAVIGSFLEKHGKAIWKVLKRDVGFDALFFLLVALLLTITLIWGPNITFSDDVINAEPMAYIKYIKPEPHKCPIHVCPKPKPCPEIKPLVKVIVQCPELILCPDPVIFSLNPEPKKQLIIKGGEEGNDKGNDSDNGGSDDSDDGNDGDDQTDNSSGCDNTGHSGPGQGHGSHGQGHGHGHGKGGGKGKGW